MNLEDLYKQKGELLTTIEISQAKLRSVNDKIVGLLNNDSNNNLPERMVQDGGRTTDDRSAAGRRSAE